MDRVHTYDILEGPPWTTKLSWWLQNIQICLSPYSRCPIMVLDEADQLLAPNFSEDMNHINLHCGKAVERQTVLVSATLSQVRNQI